MPEEKKKILVADDSDDARSGLAIFLQVEGYEVDEAENGEKAVELLNQNPYDLVLTDLKMQDIDGIGVLKETKKVQPDTEVILMTAFASVESAVDAMKLGAYDYITKPLNMDELKHAMQRCLEKQELVAEVAGLKELVSLYEVSKGVNRVMELDQLLNLIVELAADTLKAEGGSIMILDRKSGNLMAKAATGRRKDIVLGKVVKLGERIAGYAAEHGDDIYIDGALKDDDRFCHLEQYDGITSAITVPLVRKNKLVGVINLNRSKPMKGFQENDLKLLSIFASQAAVAIENSYLFDNLQQEKEILDTLFSEMQDGALLLDEEFKVVVINQAAAEKFFGSKEADCISKPLHECVAGLTPSIPWGKLQQSTDSLTDFELSRETDNPLFLSATVSRIKDDTDKIVNYIMVFRNVTEERREEMIKMNFLRLMSHKLRTPLTSIIGFSNALNEARIREKFTDSEKESLQIIESEGNKLSSLVDKLLRFTLLETEKLEAAQTRAGLEEIIKAAMDQLSTYISDSGADVKVDASAKTLPELFVDKDRTREALENLIENAIKFNDKDDKKVIITAKMISDDFVQVEVIDNGPGIPPEERDTVFQKFYQLEKYFTGQVEGAGLGLALVKQIIEANGGRIWVESKVGKGSKFIFTLPTN